MPLEDADVCRWLATSVASLGSLVLQPEALECRQVNYPFLCLGVLRGICRERSWFLDS